MAYKKDVDDMRELPALKTIDLRKNSDAQVTYNDPHIQIFRGTRLYADLFMESVPLTEEFLQQADYVLLVTDHSTYPYKWIASQAGLIVDTHNAFNG